MQWMRKHLKASEKIIFHDDGYTVFKIRPKQQIHTCTGASPLIQEGQFYPLGQLVDGKYGQQLRCSVITPVLQKLKHIINIYHQA